MIDTDKLDRAALAILSLTLHETPKAWAGDDNWERFYRVWKGVDWEITNRLHEQGYILDPRNKTKSLYLTQKGMDAAKAALEEMFSVDTPEP